MKELWFGPDEQCFYAAFNHCMDNKNSYDKTFEKTMCMHYWLVNSCNGSGFRYEVLDW